MAEAAGARRLCHGSLSSPNALLRTCIHKTCTESQPKVRHGLMVALRGLTEACRLQLVGPK